MNATEAQNQLLSAYVARDNLQAQLRQAEETIRDLRNFIAGAHSAAEPRNSGSTPEPQE